MEPAQPASDAVPQPDHPNANNEKVGPEDLNPFEKEQAQVAHKYAMDIINKQGATKGKADSLLDLRGKHRVPYPSIETLPQPKPVDFALQGSDVYIISFMETHPQLKLELTCPNQDCGASSLLHRRLQLLFLLLLQLYEDLIVQRELQCLLIILALLQLRKKRS